MFGFGEVRTHLGVVFSDSFGIFEGFGRISGKIEEIIRIWAMSGVLRCGVGTPHRSKGPHHGMACPRDGMAEKGIFPSLGSLLLCFGFDSFFRCSEDSSIG